MSKNQRDKVYKNISKHINIGDFEKFNNALDMEGGVERVYRNISKHINIGDFEKFNNAVALTDTGSDDNANNSPKGSSPYTPSSNFSPIAKDLKDFIESTDKDPFSELRRNLKTQRLEAAGNDGNSLYKGLEFGHFNYADLSDEQIKNSLDWANTNVPKATRTREPIMQAGVGEAGLSPTAQFMRINDKENYVTEEIGVTDPIHQKLIYEQTQRTGKRETERIKKEQEKLNRFINDNFNVTSRVSNGGLIYLDYRNKQTGELLSQSEVNAFFEARKNYEDALDTYAAPSKYDNTSGSANVFRGMGSTLTDEDFWVPMKEIGGSLTMKSIADKAHRNEDLSEIEAHTLSSYFDMLGATEARSEDLSLGYQIGEGIPESVMFMAEMALGGGVTKGTAKVFAKALSKAGNKKLAKLFTEQAFAKGAETILKRIGNSAGRGLQNTVSSTATAMATPTMYSGISDDMLQAAVMGDDYDALDLMRSVANTALEVGVERVGGKGIDWVLTKAWKPFNIPIKSTALASWGKRGADIVQSFPAELGEEYTLGAINLMRSYNPLFDDESNQQLWDEGMHLFSEDGQKVLWGSIGGMMFVPGMAKAANIGKNIYDYKKSRAYMVSRMGEMAVNEEVALNTLNTIEESQTTEELNENIETLRQSFIQQYNKDKEDGITEQSEEDFKVELDKHINNYKKSLVVGSKTLEIPSKMSEKERGQLEQSWNTLYAIQSKRVADTNRSNSRIQKVKANGIEGVATIKSGNLVLDENGDIDKEKSDDVITFVGEDGIIRQGGINDIQSVEMDKDASQVQQEDIALAVRVDAHKEQYPIGSFIADNQTIDGRLQQVVGYAENGIVVQTMAADEAGVEHIVNHAIPYDQTEARIAGSGQFKQGDEININGVNHTIENVDAQGNHILVNTDTGEKTPYPAQTLIDYLNANPEAKVAFLTTKAIEEVAEEAQPQQVAEPIDIESLLSLMQENAELTRQLELTPENWEAEFGENGIVNTPIGEVKMGENQYLKLLKNNRESEFGMITPTLTNPDLIIEENDGNTNSERGSKLLYVKTFYNESGEKYVNFTSVTVSKEGKEVVVSNHQLRDKQLRDKVEKGKILWNKFDTYSDSMGANQPLSSSAIQDPNSTLPGSNGQSISSDNKDTQNISAPQYPTDQKGNPLFEQMSVEESVEVLNGKSKTIRTKLIDNNMSAAQKSIDKAQKKFDNATDLVDMENAEAEVIAQQNRLAHWTAIKQTFTQAAIAETLQAQNQSAQQETTENTNQPTEKITSAWADAPKVVGNTASRTLPNGTQIQGQYTLVPAGAAIPSHNPLNGYESSEGFPVNENGQNVNDRDYRNDVTAQQETERAAQNYDGRAVENIPTVSPEGVVYDGNGRTMAGIIAAQNGTDTKYAEALKANAANYGFTAEQIVSMPNARIVFVTNEVLPYTTETFAQFNQNEKKSQSSTERAIAKGKTISDQAKVQILSIIDSYSTLDALFASPVGVSQLLNTLETNGIIASNDRAALTELNEQGDSVLSPTGRSFVADTLFGILFDEQTIRLVGTNRKLKQTMVRATSAIVENAKLREYALSEEINKAIQLLNEAQKTNNPVSLYINQGDIELGYAKDRYTPFEIYLAKALESGKNVFSETLSKYNQESFSSLGGQTDMFTGEVKTKEDIISDTTLFKAEELSKQEIIDDILAEDSAENQEKTIIFAKETSNIQNNETRTDLHSNGGVSTQQGGTGKVYELRPKISGLAERIAEAQRNGSSQKAIDDIIREFVEENDLFIPFDELNGYTPFIGGNENINYLNKQDGYIYKMNNLMNNGGSVLSLIGRINLHNMLFPNTAYEFVGFTSISRNGAMYPIFKQRYVNNAIDATETEISDYMQSLGFVTTGKEAEWTNGTITVGDLRPRNVLKIDGNIAVIDADLKLNPKQALKVTVEQAQAEVERLGVNGNVTVLTDVSQVENADAKRAIANGKRVSGWYETGTGDAYIYLPHIRSVEDLRKTLLHEVVAHKGLAKLLGKEAYQKLCDMVFGEAMSEQAQKRWLDYAAQTSDKYAERRKDVLLSPSKYNALLKELSEDPAMRIIAADEYMATLSERTLNDVSAWDKVKQIIRDMLRSVGFNIKLTNADLRSLISKSKRDIGKEGKVIETSQGQNNETRGRISEDINSAFNEQLMTLTKENADSKIFKLGYPSDILLSAGVQNKEMKLYGSKVIKKMKTHGFKFSELRNLPNAVANPIAVFNNTDREGNRAILTELQTEEGNFLVTLDLGKGGDVDFNIVSTVFGKRQQNVIDWINNDLAKYINKEKALNYLHLSAPIAEASNNQELLSATKIVENFQNPTVESVKNDTSKQQILSNPDNRYEDSNGTMFRIAYHGSPHSFDKFDHSYMGTGEGAQAFGWGTYLTEVEGIGRSYASSTNMFSSSQLKYNDKPFEDEIKYGEWDDMFTQLFTEFRDETVFKHQIKNLLWVLPVLSSKRRSEFERQVKKLLNAIDNGEVAFPQGNRNLYTVDFPDDNGKNYLHWENVVDEKTIKKVRKVAKSMGYNAARMMDDYNGMIDPNNLTGDVFYSMMSSTITDLNGNSINNQVVSNILSKAGFVGISYPAQATTGGRADNARNYVIFDENDIKITNHTRFRQETPSHIAAERTRIEEEAKANGTWLKAPNGKATKLSPQQWVDVRLASFKEWFGDWEKVLRIDKLRNAESIVLEWGEQYPLNRKDAKQWLKDNIRGEYTNKDTGEKIDVLKIGVDKVTSHGEREEAHLKSLISIPQLIEDSTFIEERPNRKDNDKYDSYRYYVAGLNIDGVEHTVKVVVGVKGDNRYYDHELTTIEKGNLINSLSLIAKQEAENQTSFSEYKDTTLISLLQTNSSKVVDENGEPLVVYHGTNYPKFSEFRGDDNGIYFSSADRASWYATNADIPANKKFAPIFNNWDEVEGYAKDNDIDFNELNREEYENGYVFDNKIVFDLDDITNIIQEDIERFEIAALFPVFLNIRNPRRLNAKGKHALNVDDSRKNKKQDGVIVRNIRDLPLWQKDKDWEDTNYIVFSPNQIKSATDNTGEYSKTNNGIRFRKTSNGSLVGLHNLSQSNFLHAMKMGGLANPSMAVINPEVGGFYNFGDITMIAPSSLIDKKTGRNAGTWTADAYTPRYPSISYVAPKDIYKKMQKEVANISNEELQRGVMYGAIERAENGKQAFIDNRHTKLLYIAKEKAGISFVHNSTDYEYGLTEKDDIFANIDWDSYKNELSDKQKKRINELYDNYVNDHLRRKKSIWERLKKDNSQINERLDAERKLHYDENGEIVADNYQFRNFLFLIRGSIKSRGEVDLHNTEISNIENYKLNNSDSQEYKDYQKWASDFYDSLGIEEKIFLGFTPSGNRRYAAHTLENASEEMKREGRAGGENFSGMGATRAKLIKPQTSLKKIKANIDKIVSKENFEETKELLSNTYYDLQALFTPRNDYSYREAEYRLEDALNSSNPKDFAKKEYNIDLTEEQSGAIKDFREALINMPTEYFETKFERPVYLNEFAGAVIPKDTDLSIIGYLNNNNIPYKEYDGIENRNTVTNEFINEIDAGDKVLFRTEVDSRLASLHNAEDFINNSLKNGLRDKSYTLQLPTKTRNKIRAKLGRDFNSHKITSNSLVHIEREHGENGRKNTTNSIPITKKDMGLIPYIMVAPDSVERGSVQNSRESIRYYKYIGNGYVVVVEKEHKNSPNDMETISMWAELSNSGANSVSTIPPNKNVQNVITTKDAAKIRKDAENAIIEDVKSEPTAFRITERDLIQPEYDTNKTLNQNMEARMQWLEDVETMRKFTAIQIPEIRFRKYNMSVPQELIQRLEQRDAIKSAVAVEDYNQEVLKATKFGRKFIRGDFDDLADIEYFQEYMKEQGATITDMNNVYENMFHTNRRVLEARERFDRNEKKHLIEASAIFQNVIRNADDPVINDLKWRNLKGVFKDKEKRNVKTGEILDLYLQAKDIQEAIELGLPDRGQKAFVTNLDIAHDNFIERIESIVPKEVLDNLHTAVRNVNQFAIQYMYDGGLIDADTYNKYQERQYYVPERGWKERDLDERELDYVKNNKGEYDNSFNAALIKSKGRTSLAAPPIPYMLSIVASSIVATEKNKTMQFFLRFVENNEGLGIKTGAFKFNKIWALRSKDENGKTIITNGEPQMYFTYAAPTTAMQEHDKNIDQLIKETRKEIAEIQLASKGNLSLEQEANLKRLDDKIGELENEKHISSYVTEDQISHRTKSEQGQHRVIIKRNGQAYEILMADERVANAIKRNFNYRDKKRSVVSKYMSIGTRTMASMKTQYNPEFAVNNLSRDVQLSVIMNWAKYGSTYTGQFIANLGKYALPLMKYTAYGAKKFPLDSEMRRLLEEFEAYGVKAGFSFTKPPTDIAKDLQKEIRAAEKRVKNLKEFKTGDEATIGGVFGAASEWSETLVRFTQYATARKMGKSEIEAAFMAKEITVNFDRRGALSRSMSPLYAFFNASLQGVYTIAKPMFKDKKYGKAFRYKFCMAASLYTIGGFLMTMLQPDDAEDEVFWTEYDRMSNFILGDVKITMPHLVRAFNAIGVNAALAMQGKKTWGQAALASADFFVGDLFPMGTLPFEINDKTGFTWTPDKFFRDFVPTTFSPLYDVWQNTNFMGYNVYKEPFIKSQEGELLDVNMGKRNVNKQIDWVCRQILIMTGGNPEHNIAGEGVIDLNPSAWEHIIKDYGGGAPTLVVDIMHFGLKAATDWDEVNSGDIPFVRKFTRPYNEDRVYTSQYWDLKTRTDFYGKQLKDYRKTDPELYKEKIESERYQIWLKTQGLTKRSKENPDVKDIQELMKANQAWVKEDLKELNR